MLSCRSYASLDFVHQKRTACSCVWITDARNVGNVHFICVSQRLKANSNFSSWCHVVNLLAFEERYGVNEVFCLCRIYKLLRSRAKEWKHSGHCSLGASGQFQHRTWVSHCGTHACMKVKLMTRNQPGTSFCAKNSWARCSRLVFYRRQVQQETACVCSWMAIT